MSRFHRFYANIFLPVFYEFFLGGYIWSCREQKFKKTSESLSKFVLTALSLYDYSKIFEITSLKHWKYTHNK